MWAIPACLALFLALAGMALGYFLALIPIIILSVIGIIWIFLILKRPYSAGALFPVAMVSLITISMVITAAVVGTIPVVPFIHSVGQATGIKFAGFHWSWLFRRN